MKKILVTGAGGYIGSITSYLLLKAGYRVVGIDSLVTGYLAPMRLLEEKFGRENFHYYKRSTLEEIDDIFTAEPDIEAVIHFAASTSVPESIQNPDQYFTNNVVGSQRLLSAMLRHNQKKIIFSSTAGSFGDLKYSPIDDIHPQNPTNPYGRSKLMVEQMLDWYDRSHGFKFIAFRYFNVTGASDDALFGDSKNPSPHLIQNAVRGALGIAPFVFQCGTNNPTPDGSPIRDYIDVVDLANAHILGVEYLLSGGKSDKMNLGTTVGLSVLEAISKVEQVTGKSIEKHSDNSREGEDPILVTSSVKAKEILKWQPNHTIEQSIQNLVKWYSAHPHGWEE